MLRAWGDESGSDHRVDPGTYIFGAVVADSDNADNARDVFRSLLLPGQKKTHWRDESDRRRDQIIASIGESGLDSIVVARIGALDERDERRRRKCFERFAYVLIRDGVAELELESRGSVADERDIEMVQALRASRSVPTSFRVTHAPGPNEPLLWAADAVCGAYASSRTGNPKWFRTLERLIDFELVSYSRK